ncbi:Dolichyl-phosphate-mannose-protein mannosyltransferase [Singulisphaera sp. GP187]|uniref:ArnT family glycosyltransferase n=1 Tax=Singulisphaera sp. GP187 TaxID=1882752 RepID=UPI00092BDDF4|nr:glycosyltransferase family 39 protein [Singulisphaera sp. GP187]SIO62827.1 Dolichyl-phosphate-mannose-protein mannosyltransferase [Singulisphaera sp. GP187]
MLDCLFILGLGLLAAAVGLRLLDALDARLDQEFDTLALAIPLGLGVVALATLALGACGVLRPSGLSVLFTVTALLVGRHTWSDVGRLIRSSASPIPGRTALDISLFIGVVVTTLGTFLTALAPVTDGDALCYHLQVPKLFLVRGGIFFDPDLHETVYPLLTEMLYAVGLAFRGPVACRLVQWLLGLVFAANVTALARPSLGARAWWAGAIALLVPAVSNGMGAPLNDVALAAFGTAAMVALARDYDRPRAQSLILVGLLAGLAMGVKYPALVLVGLLGLAIAARRLGSEADPSPTGDRPRTWSSRLWLAGSGLALFGLIALLVGGSWYLRAWMDTGNPVYPFFRHYFGGAGLDEVLDPIKRPMAVTPWTLITALVPLTLHPDRFDSFSHQFGPAFLLFLPALLLEKAPRRVLAIVALGLAFLMICLTQRQSMRFVLTAIGPMAVGVAWLVSTWYERRTLPCRVLLLVLLLIVGFEASLAAARARHGLNVVLGRETSEHYLMRREPTYRVGQWIAANLPATTRIVGQDHRGYYLPCDYTMELAHRRRTGLGRQGDSADTIVGALKRRGFTHVMFCPPVPERAVEFDPTLSRLLADWVKPRQPIYREAIADADHVVRRYSIYALDGSTASRPVGAGMARR